MSQYIDIKSKFIRIGKLNINIHLVYFTFLFIIPWTIYLKTSCPTVTVGDVGEMIAAPYVLGIPHPTGYPTFCILGKMFTMIFPFGNTGLRMNLVPALFGALAAIFIYLMIFEFFKKAEIAAICSLLFSVSRIFWSQAISAEIYTLNIMFFAAWIYFLIRWINTSDSRNIYSFAFFYALGLTNHMTMSLALPALIFIMFAYYRRLFTFKHFVMITCLTLLLLSAYWYLPMRSATSDTEIMSSLLWGDQTKFFDFKRHLTGSTFHGLMFSQNFFQVYNNFKVYLNILNWEFTPPFILILIMGFFLFAKRNPKLFVFTFLIFLTDLFFSLNYKIEDINVFYLPSFLMALIWIGAGINYLMSTRRLKKITSILPILIIIPFLISYFPNNFHDNFISYDYGNAVVNSVEKGAVLLSSGWITPFIFSYLKLVENRGNDINMKVDDKGTKLKGLLFNPIYPDGIKPEKDPPIYTHIPFDIPNKPEFEAVSHGACYIVRSDLKTERGHLPLWWCSPFRGLDDEEVFKDFHTSSLVAMCIYLEGESYFQEEFTEEAIKYYNKSIKSAIDNKQIFNNLGTIYEKKGWYNKAKEAFTIALILDPNFLQAKRNIANIYYKQGNYNEAMKLYSELADNKLGANKEIIFIALGDMYIEKGDYQKALDEFKTALTRFPSSKDARQRVGLTYAKLGNYYKAIDTFKDLIYIDPENFRAHNNLGGLYQKLGNIQDARVQYKNSIEINKSFTDAYLNLAKTYAIEGNLKEAENILLEALEVGDKTPDLFNTIGILNVKLKDTDKALEFFKKSVNIDKSYKKGWINIEAIYKQKDDKKNARNAKSMIEEIENKERLNKLKLR